MGQAKARYPSVQLQVRLPWRQFMVVHRGSSNWEMAESGDRHLGRCRAHFPCSRDSCWGCPTPPHPGNSNI